MSVGFGGKTAYELYDRGEEERVTGGIPLAGFRICFGLHPNAAGEGAWAYAIFAYWFGWVSGWASSGCTGGTLMLGKSEAALAW